MKINQFRKVTAMLLVLLMAINFSTLNPFAENIKPEDDLQVTAIVESGAVAVGTSVIFSCNTEGAFIMYSINEGEYEEYYASEKITLDTFPICLKAYASKDGVNGDISTFNYTEKEAAAEKTMVTSLKYNHGKDLVKAQFIKVISKVFNLKLEN